MNVVELIVTKREGGSLTGSEVQQLVEAYTAGNVPDYQMSSFLMASFLNGLSEEESVALTDAMLRSGETVDLSAIPGIKVDKHSTGGVGDKVSLILAPIVAACGVPVPMISGRGLGHTGGTLDKLESIPGFNTQLDIEAYKKQLHDLGIVLIGQTAEIAPADRKLYALRDVTGTVEFIPFIAASIMSKKLAEGIDALVLDVKCGSGAFMKTEESGRELAEKLVGIGERFGKKTVALLTDMSTPLGRAVGNWPEMEESIRCLKGESVEDLMEVTMALAAEMIVLGGVEKDLAGASALAREAISSGKALKLFRQLVERQFGDARVVDRPEIRRSESRVRTVMAPVGTGPYVHSIDAHSIGKATVALGAGRQSKEDDVDPLAGIYLLKKESEHVAPGEPLVELYATSEERFKETEEAVLSSFSYTESPFSVRSRLLNRYSDGRWMHPAGHRCV